MIGCTLQQTADICNVQVFQPNAFGHSSSMVGSGLLSVRLWWLVCVVWHLAERLRLGNILEHRLWLPPGHVSVAWSVKTHGQNMPRGCPPCVLFQGALSRCTYSAEANRPGACCQGSLT